MAIDFKSDEFKELKDNLIIEFNQYLQEKDFEKYHDLIKDLLVILENKNYLLRSLSNIELNHIIGNNIYNSHRINSIDAYYNNLTTNSNNITAEIKISSLIIVLYVCIYKTWIISREDVAFHEEYQNTVKKLFNHSIILKDGYRNIISEYPYYCLKEINRAYEKNKGKIDKTYNVISNFESHMETIEKYSKTIEKYTSDVSAIETKLEKQRQEFNFIGLSDAFQKMKDDKQNELKSEQRYNIFLRVLIAILLSLKLSYAIFGNFSGFDAKFAFISLSSIFLIAVLIYFFRISLMNIKSIKSQILQLDLRLSLCQFIHNYSTESKDMRDNMKDSLDRFESIIFSPIVANEEQIPATFDNLDQFIKMMNVANGGKGENK